VNCTITDNTAHYSGGGIYSVGELPTPPPPPPPPPPQPGSSGEESSTEIISDCNSNVPTIAHCIITNNTADRYGGGIYNSLEGEQIITHCIVSGNIAGNDGGGIYNIGNWPTVANCVISCNRADYAAGGILNWNAEATITNCTIVDNSSLAIYNVNGSDPVLINNCILRGNEREIALRENYSIGPYGVSTASVSYCNVQGGEEKVIVGFSCTLDWGEGNIDEDPCFADPGYWADKNDPNIIVEPDDPNALWIDGDYHLKSQAGRWDANSKSWVQDFVTSLNIDAGDPNSDWTAELWPHGKQINMGTYGGTPQASMSLSDAGNIADFDNDGYVGYTDMFTDKWLCEKLLLPEDLNRDGFVNFIDIAIFAGNFDPPPPPPPAPASNPNPTDNALSVNIDVDLSWMAGLGAISHYVYFGTSNPPPFVGIQTTTTFDPGTMAYTTKYYWQIDEVGLGGTITGAVWNFTTIQPPPPM
jgi:hypothetical protein